MRFLRVSVFLIVYGGGQWYDSWWMAGPLYDEDRDERLHDMECFAVDGKRELGHFACVVFVKDRYGYFTRAVACMKFSLNVGMSFMVRRLNLLLSCAVGQPL